MVIQIPKLVIHRACGYEHTVPRMKRIPDLKAAKRAIVAIPKLASLPIGNELATPLDLAASSGSFGDGTVAPRAWGRQSTQRL